jgi:hypothetical protein
MNWRFGRSSMVPAIAICRLSAVLVIAAPSLVLADQLDCTRSVSRH